MSGLRVFVEDPDGYPVIQSVPHELVAGRIGGVTPSKGGHFELITDVESEGVVLYDSCFTLVMTHKILRTDLDAFLNALVSSWTTNAPGKHFLALIADRTKEQIEQSFDNRY